MVILFLTGNLMTLAQSADLTTVDHKYVDKNGYPVTGEFQVQIDDQTDMDLTLSNGDISGLAASYYPDGNVKEYGNFLDGNRVGDWSLFNQSGERIIEASYLKGEKHGIWYIWDANGNLRCKMKFRHGVKVGIWKFWDENGKLLMKKSY